MPPPADIFDAQAYYAAFEYGRAFEQGRAYQKEASAYAYEPAAYGHDMGFGWQPRDPRMHAEAPYASMPARFDPELPLKMRVRETLTQEPMGIASQCWDSVEISHLGF